MQAGAREGFTNMANQTEQVPKFESEDQERDFWARHDSVGYVDWSKATPVKLPHLKPTTKSISIRVPESLLDDLKIMANKRDVPYQSLLKMILAEWIDDERRAESTSRLSAGRSRK